MNWIKKIQSRLLSQPKKDHQRGAITMVETLIALGIGAGILASVFAGLPALTASRNASNALNGLTQITSVVRMTFGVRNNFAGLDNDLAIQLAGFPRHFISDSNVIHPWGGTVTIAEGDTAQEFTITYADLSKDACTSVVTSTTELAESVNVGGTVIDLVGDDSDPDNIVAPTDIATTCSSNSPSDVTWTFRG